MEAYVERQIVAGRYTSAGGAQPELHDLQDSVPEPPLLLTDYWITGRSPLPPH